MTATARPDRAANYRQRQERTAPIDWAAASAAAAQVLLGEPNPQLSSSRQRRWGNKGSLALNLETGFWQDYEAANGGGTLQLIARETGCSAQEAMEWLVERGIIPPRPEGPPPAAGAGSGSSRSSSKGNQAAGPRPGREPRERRPPSTRQNRQGLRPWLNPVPRCGPRSRSSPSATRKQPPCQRRHHFRAGPALMGQRGAAPRPGPTSRAPGSLAAAPSALAGPAAPAGRPALA